MHAELDELPSLKWMPSRIPVRDALAAFVKDGTKPPQYPFRAQEERYYPCDGGFRIVLPYDGQALDISGFEIVKGFWDHTTCDWCGNRIDAMELCFVTAAGAYVALCGPCYSKHVVAKLGVTRWLLWHIKRTVGIRTAA